MPVLKAKEVKEVTLPSSSPEDPAIVTINTRPTVGDFMILDTKTMSETQMTVKLLVRLIEKWNYTDEQGNPLPVNEENVSRLDPRDLEALTKELDLSSTSGGALSSTEKKTSS